MTRWTPHNWPNKPMPTSKVIVHVRALLSDISSEYLRDTCPLQWARSVCALGKLADDQRGQIMHSRVEYNLGKHQTRRLMTFIEAWDEIGREDDRR